MELGIDEGCLWASMAEHVTDSLEGLTAAQHMNGQRVTQDVGTAAGRLDARLLQAVRQPAVDLATKVLSTMKARGAGKILNVVKPARAVQISRRMAGTKR